jgi:hypothetical protein
MPGEFPCGTFHDKLAAPPEYMTDQLAAQAVASDTQSANVAAIATIVSKRISDLPSFERTMRSQRLIHLALDQLLFIVRTIEEGNEALLRKQKPFRLISVNGACPWTR